MGSSTASSQCAAARCSCRRNQRSLDHGTAPGHTDQLEDEKECTGQVQRGRSPYLMLESGQGMTLEACRRSSYRSRCFLAVRSGCRCPTRERPLVSETASALKSGCQLWALTPQSLRSWQKFWIELFATILFPDPGDASPQPPVRNDIAGTLRRMQPRCQQYRGGSQPRFTPLRQRLSVRRERTQSQQGAGPAGAETHE